MGFSANLHRMLIGGVFEKYPEKSYKIETHEGFQMKLGKSVETSVLYVMLYCSCQIHVLNINRHF